MGYSRRIPARFVEAWQALPESLAPQAAPGVWEVVLSMLPPPGRVLHAGASRGGMSWVLGQASYDVVNVDVHAEHFAATGMTCQKVDLLDALPFESETFDVVLAVEVMEHLENPWFFMREALRILRPGGHLIFTSPNVCSLPSRLEFLRCGVLPYFKQESFIGCYHVTPIFHWSVELCCYTVNAELAEVQCSRVEWPRHNDIPRRSRRARRMFLRWLPRNHLFGEIAVYQIVKAEGTPRIGVGHHAR